MMALLVVLATGVLAVQPAGAAGGPGTPITADMNATGAVITGGGQPDRTLDSDQAAAFSQAWLSLAFYGTPVLEEPPAGTPVFRVTTSYVSDRMSGQNIVDVATAGDSIWLALPAQEAFYGISITEDQANTWFRGNSVILAAFKGESSAQPVENSLVDPEDEPVPATAEAEDSPVLLIGVIVLAAVIIIGTVVIVTRRRSASA